MSTALSKMMLERATTDDGWYTVRELNVSASVFIQAWGQDWNSFEDETNLL
jgi:hypothetical protein